MKFVTKRNNQIISGVICLMFIIDLCVAFESKRRFYLTHKSHRVHRSHRIHKSFRSEKVYRVHKSYPTVPKTTLTQQIRNPWGRLAIGALETLTPDPKALFNCIPNDWRGEKFNQAKYVILQGQFNKLPQIANSLLTGLAPIIKMFCNPLKHIKNSVITLIGWIFKDTDSLIFIGGKYMLKRFRSKLDLWSWLNAKVTAAGDWVSGSLKSAWDTVDNAVKDALSVTYSKLIEFKDKILNIFKSETFKTLNIIVKCLFNTRKTNAPVKNIFEIMERKFQNIIYNAGAKNYTLFIAKLIWSLICRIGDFEPVVNYFVDAYKASDNADRYYFWGKFVGTITEAISGSALLNRRRRFRIR